MRVNCQLGCQVWVFNWIFQRFQADSLTGTNEVFASLATEDQTEDVEDGGPPPLLPVLTQPDALPGAEGDPPLTDGQGEVGAQQAGLGVGRHVVRTLTAVLEGDRLRHQPGTDVMSIIFNK